MSNSNSKKQEQSLNSEPVAPEGWKELARRMDRALEAYFEYHSAENMLKAIDERAANGDAHSERIIVLEPIKDD